MSRAIGKQKQTWVDENGVEMKIRQQKKKKGEQMRADHQPNKGKMITYQKKHVHFSFFVFLFAVFILSVLWLLFRFHRICVLWISDLWWPIDVWCRSFFNYFSASFTCRFSNGGRSHMRWKYFLSFSMFDILFILRTAPVSHGIWQYSEYEYPIR